ncbi:uncharacterized protein PHACADRAFT_252949 [Phanerochaete carnosa HHB-10118-sp]|uniref:Cytochrome P450 n=1 Tax=Phanerochaete carnosa (strain HHB-10118-sp) TaxID=650164 RepID=K5W3S7_PHACS|nr:uncharacterized protein PHACADRAFT_252949 [Phanerochaete carnosa HHB-10118-sp]EKM58533.1 hypothetical protein PHACADRAFT_252949 [Phanerochaete carnosa HHB-10118-sp]
MAAVDLLEKRSSFYSDRQHLVVVHDFVGGDRAFAFLGYGDDWREHRRIFHQHYHGQVVENYHPRMAKEARKLTIRLLTTHDFMQSLRVFAGAIILGITFGMEIQDHNNLYVLLAEKAINRLLVAATPGSYMVDSIPLMRYIPSWAPGGQFKHEAADLNEHLTLMFEQPIEFVKKALLQGIAEPCVAATLLGNMDDKEDLEKSKRERVIQNVTGVAYLGGADSTASALGTFILAMVMNPAVQSTAQEQIDRVVGSACLPDFTYRDSLPYVAAIMYEVLRWRPVAPLGIAHRVMVDDEYNGYHIPAGAAVVSNAWAILHDPARFPSPDTFDPTRWLTPDGQLSKTTLDATNMAVFGFGRRICPGNDFAMASIWIAMVHILAIYNIEKPVDDAGKVVEPSGEYTSGFVVHPVPFGAVFKPRSEAGRSLIESLIDD